MRTLLVTLAVAVSVCWSGPAGAAPEEPAPARISNVFADTDVRQVILEIAQASGETILPDASVKETSVTLDLRDDDVDSALDKLAIVAGLIWKRKGEVYLVSTPSPDAPLFSEFAETRVYVPRTMRAESLYALLTRHYAAFAQLDKDANLVSVTAPEPQLSAILRALAAADAPRRQFVVEAMVTEIVEQEGQETGFSWSWRHFAQGPDHGLAYASATAGDVARLKSMIERNQATLKANPRVTAQEGREAMITVGQEVYFSVVSGNANFPVTQLQRVNTGVTLKFTGYVDPDGMISLHLQPEVSDAVASVAGNPTTTVRRADTHLRVRSGETIAIGGLIHDAETRRRSRVPILADLPLVGGLFRSERRVHRRSEIVILVTPRLEPASTPTPGPAGQP